MRGWPCRSWPNGMTLLVDIDLGGHRNAVQDAKCLTARPGSVGLIGRRQSLFVHPPDDRIDGRIDLVHAGQNVGYDLSARDLS